MDVLTELDVLQQRDQQLQQIQTLRVQPNLRLNSRDAAVKFKGVIYSKVTYIDRK